MKFEVEIELELELEFDKPTNQQKTNQQINKTQKRSKATKPKTQDQRPKP